MELPHASFDQFVTARDGQRVLVEADVQGVVQQIREIDPHLTVHWNEQGAHFVVIERLENGDEKLVTTALGLDGRLVKRLQWLASPGYDFVRELEAVDAKVEAEKDYQFSERIGEHAEPLAHAIRKDFSDKSKIVLPRGV